MPLVEFSFMKHVIRIMSLLRESPAAMIGVGLTGGWVCLALFAPIFTSFDPNAQDFSALADPTPGWFFSNHWLGTDHLGRDIWARLIWGSRIVLTLVPGSILTAYIVGSTMGMVAGYFGGWVDDVINFISDVVLSFPVLILYIILIISFGPSPLNIVFAVTFVSSPGISRIVRGLVFEIRTKEFVDAAKIRGENPLFIMIVEQLPNIRGPLIVDACLRMGYTTITIGVLGFLGLGLPPPDPDWGGMVKETSGLIMIWPHMAIAPCLAISSLVIGFNLLADGIHEISIED